MDVSENSRTPKASILIGLSIINHPFWGTLETPIYIYAKCHVANPQMAEWTLTPLLTGRAWDGPKVPKYEVSKSVSYTSQASFKAFRYIFFK